jgi:hypothetical protein
MTDPTDAPRRAARRIAAHVFGPTLVVLAAAALIAPAGQKDGSSRTARVTAALTTPVNISHASSPCDTPLVGADASGNAYAVWFEYTPGRQFYFATNKNGAWSTPYQFERLYYDVQEAGYPWLAVSSSGVCHLIFQDGREASYDIYHLAYSNSWGAAVNVSSNEGGSCYGGVAVNPDDNSATVVWQDGTGRSLGWDIDGRTRSASGSWGANQVLPVNGGYMPKITIDGSGTAHMAWGTGWGTTVWYSRNRTPQVASGWTSPTLIKWDVGEDWSYPKVAADNSGNAWVAWMDGTRGNDEIFVIKIAADGTVGTEVDVSNSAASSTDPTLAVDRNNGNVYVAWAENGDIYVNAYTSGSWSGALNVTNAGGCGQPFLSVDAAGNAHLVYAQQAGGQSQIYYAKVSAGPVTPGLRVTSPNGGESWAPGSAQSIAWTSAGVTISSVKIELSTNGGSTWSTVAASAPNTGVYSWTVPNSLSTTCLVRVGDTGSSGLSDVSDAFFSIANAMPTTKITVVAPNGGEVWQALTTQNIVWATQGTVGPVHIELTTNAGASWSDIIASTDNTGYLGWVVPDSPSSACAVRISQASTGTPADTSDAVFTISAPPRAAPPLGLSLSTSLADSGVAKINALSWYDNPNNAAITLQSYKIYRKPADAADSQFALIATVSPQTHAYQDANLPLSTKFTYVMTAFGRTGGDSDPSDYAIETEVFPPLSAEVVSIINSSLFKKELLNVVSWQDNPLNGPVSVVRYYIYRKSAGQDDSQYKKIAWVLGAEFEYRDRKLSATDSFVYRITAVDANGTESVPIVATKVGG